MTLAVACRVSLEYKLDLVADAPEAIENLFLRARGVGRIVEAPVVAVGLPGKHRARSIGVSADRDDGGDIPIQKLVHVLGGVMSNIDSDFLEDGNGLGMDVPGGIGPGAMDFHQVSGRMPKNAFRHVASAGVSGTKNQNSRFVAGFHFDSRSPIGAT